MDRNDLLLELEDLLERSGMPGSADALLQQLSAYSQAMDLEQSPEALLSVAQSVVTSHQRGIDQKDFRPEPLGDWRLLGNLEPALCAMHRRAGISPRDFKRRFPSLWAKVGPYVGSRRIDSRLLDAAPGREYEVFEGRWMGDERVAALPGHVLLLGIFDSFLSPAERRLASYITDTSKQSGHPVLPAEAFFDQPGKLLTAGWVRLGWEQGSDGMLIEEVQSDWFAAKTQWSRMPESAHQHLPVDPQQMSRLLDKVTARLEHLQSDLLGAAFRWGCLHGVDNVWMPGFAARSAVTVGHTAPPRSIYEALPRSFGMRPWTRRVPLPVPSALQELRFWSLSL